MLLLEKYNRGEAADAFNKALKINPNTAHKVVAQLISTGLLETRPGIGTVVATLPQSTATERTELLGTEIEQLVVEARKLGIGLDDMIESISRHWERLGGETPDRGGRGNR